MKNATPLAASALLFFGIVGGAFAQNEPAPLTPIPPGDATSNIPSSGSTSAPAPGLEGAEQPAEAPAVTAAEPATAPDAGPNYGADPASAVAAISPFVGDVQVLGPWTDGDRRGLWRTAMVQSLSEVSGNRFFVQQIEIVNGEPTVSSTTEITEVGEVNGAVIGYRADEPSAEQPAQLTVFLDIVPLDGEIAETYELFFTAGERYVFGPASN